MPRFGIVASQTRSTSLERKVVRKEYAVTQLTANLRIIVSD